MNWISVENRLPPLPENGFEEMYLVCVKKIGRTSSVKWAIWRKKMHRTRLEHESKMQVLIESKKAIWLVQHYKSSEVTHWMTLPEKPM